MNIKITIAPGELADKITILETRLLHVDDAAKHATLGAQLNILQQIFMNLPPKKKINTLVEKLRVINKKLWNAEDAIRIAKKQKDSNTFCRISHTIVRLNDNRSAIKCDINSLFEQTSIDQKIYKK